MSKQTWDHRDYWWHTDWEVKWLNENRLQLFSPVRFLCINLTSWLVQIVWMWGKPLGAQKENWLQQVRLWQLYLVQREFRSRSRWCASCSWTSCRIRPCSWSSCTRRASCTSSCLCSWPARTSASGHPSRCRTCSWTCGNGPWCCHSRPSAQTSDRRSSPSRRSSSWRIPCAVERRGSGLNSRHTVNPGSTNRSNVIVEWWNLQQM